MNFICQIPQNFQQLLLTLFSGMLVFSSFGQSSDDATYLYLIEDPETMDCGYMNAAGDTVIPLGKYYMCVTDTLKVFAIVATNSEIIGIDAKENRLFEVFNYDNGPDYISEGLFRIVENDLIGYANEQGEIVISPIYTCAWPFEEGRAKVSINCEKAMMDEYEIWQSNDWFYIDMTGKQIEK